MKLYLRSKLRKTRDAMIWHKHFAWLPVRLSDSHIHVWCHVWRRAKQVTGVFTDGTPVYTEPTKKIEWEYASIDSDIVDRALPPQITRDIIKHLQWLVAMNQTDNLRTTLKKWRETFEVDPPNFSSGEMMAKPDVNAMYDANSTAFHQKRSIK